MKPPDLDARLRHHSDQAVVHLGAPHPVEQYMDLHALARPLGQGVGKLAADVTRPVDVGLKCGGHLGPADRRQHGLKDLVAVQQRARFGSLRERRPKQHASSCMKCGPSSV